jgi:hypothetical protein
MGKFIKAGHRWLNVIRYFTKKQYLVLGSRFQLKGRKIEEIRLNGLMNRRRELYR